jgi:ElaB/YqjD/DUF883 family membrane-anchored ribosome-binding protein
MQETAMNAKNEARSLGEDLGGDAAAMQQHIQDRARELVDEGKEAMENLGTKVRGQVRDRPLTSLVVAGSIGLLIGLLVGRKL